MKIKSSFQQAKKQRIFIVVRIKEETKASAKSHSIVNILQNNEDSESVVAAKSVGIITRDVEAG